MATDAVVFRFSNKMAKRLLEIEHEEIQELKENAEKKNTKAQNPVLEGKARSLREQVYGRSKYSKSSPRSHLTSQKNNFLVSYHKEITAWLGLLAINTALDISKFPKYHTRYLCQIPVETMLLHIQIHISY